MLVAWRDDDRRAMEAIEEIIRTATEKGEGRALGLAHYATALLHNGRSRYGVALDCARRACEYEALGFFGWYLAELAEAGARCGEQEAAADALERLSEHTRAAGTDWALGVEARSRGGPARCDGSGGPDRPGGAPRRRDSGRPRFVVSQRAHLPCL
ncbi:hypothetical protein ACWEWG_36370 [Streptomyces sp. NPDC003758]